MGTQDTRVDEEGKRDYFSIKVCLLENWCASKLSGSVTFHILVFCEVVINISSSCSLSSHHAWKISNNELLSSTRKYFDEIFSLLCFTVFHCLWQYHCFFIEKSGFVVETFSFLYFCWDLLNCSSICRHMREETHKSSPKKIFNFCWNFLLCQALDTAWGGWARVRLCHCNFFFLWSTIFAYAD